ncbi:DUF6065 family protein [Asticcacaulis sp. YBE204]|uniref:DUF6065 family protein n=1 Tax=Asticcacaulis sp. YBE204 TaxID=1282363 RepID=UPI0003C3D3DB|nr:DUF6065 family protein [Asticcacaulis sp. YBE204]ESQ80995.1 hypothetical protein AEYBE204_01335 [Asticcacaulis sp. YBE204]
MELECFIVQNGAREIIPGRTDRDWMDAFANRFPYRCLPLTMANSTGWELIVPEDITIEWNGGHLATDITITADRPGAYVDHFVQSHFSHGIVTFHTGYLFRTPPGWALWASGAPNQVKDGIVPLTGLVETDWLPFPFTMNWKMTRPGIVHFEKGESFCFINVVEHKKLDDIQPVIKPIESDPDLKAQFETWSTSRAAFNESLVNRDPAAIKQAWQKFYHKGELPDQTEAPSDHMNRRRLKPVKMEGME